MSEVHGNEVQAQSRAESDADAVLDFWFGLEPNRHWAKDHALDAEIAKRFGAMRDAMIASGAEGWRDRPDTLLAAIILIDQFSRNIHRDTAEAFAGDDLAASLTLQAIEKGWDLRYPAARRAFAYMPLMHAEDAPLQDVSVAKFEALGDAANLKFAREHRDVIRQFGRYPSRNAALGRQSTAAEDVYLSQPDAGW